MQMQDGSRMCLIIHTCSREDPRRCMWQLNKARLPLHRAMSSGHMQVVKLCLTQQDLPEDSGEGLGETPLHAAARYDNVTAVRWLLRHDADMDAKDNKGWRALHHAIAQNSAQAAEILLTHGASANLIFPEDNNSDNAAEIEKCQASWFPADAHNSTVMTSTCNHGVYPIERAVSAGGWNVVEAFLSHYKEIPSVAVLELQSLLYAAIKGGHSDVLQELLSADVLDKGWDQTTALHDAALKGNMQAVQKLLSSGADATLCVSDPLSNAGLDGTRTSHSAIHAYDIGHATVKGRTALELSTSKAVTQCLRDHIHALQSRPVPCRLVHWHVADMQPPMVDNLDKLVALSRSVSDQEGAVNQYAQQLLEMQEVLATDLTAVSDSAAAARIDRELAKVLQDCTKQQQKVQACKVSLENSESAADEGTQQLSADAQSAKQAVIHLLNKAKALAQRKADMCEHMHQQKQRLSCLSVNAIADSSADQSGVQAPLDTVMERVKDNNQQLAACRKLYLAFQATRDARTQLQQCMDKEHALLQQLQGPLQQSVAHSKHLVTATAERLMKSNHADEKRHTEMLIRDLKKQLAEVQQVDS
ncbi:hypothetical protein ABBQ32_005258 [Trebouxia sp. C0010 RCD-2024]